MVLKVKTKQLGKKHFSLILEKPKNFTFYAGQYLDYQLPVKDPNGPSRAFSLSSSPTEDFLMLTTKYGITPFKKALSQIKDGETIITSHPAGTFVLDENSPAVFLAGGIGITPFRSIIKYLLDEKMTTPITLIYANSDENFLFKEELENWGKNLSNIKIIYHSTSKSGHLSKTQLEPIVQMYVNQAVYYLSGPPQMVADFEKILLGLGVDKSNIRYDPFDGY